MNEERMLIIKSLYFDQIPLYYSASFQFFCCLSFEFQVVTFSSFSILLMMRFSFSPCVCRVTQFLLRHSTRIICISEVTRINEAKLSQTEFSLSPTSASAFYPLLRSEIYKSEISDMSVHVNLRFFT